MFRIPRRRQQVDIWPGFVDAIATLLMVVIFVLMAFVLAQFYLTDAINSKDKNLISLNDDMSNLSKKLMLSEEIKEDLARQVAALQASMRELGIEAKMSMQKAQELESTLSNTVHAKLDADEKIRMLVLQVKGLQEELKRLTDLLHYDGITKKEQAKKIDELTTQLNHALLRKVEELENLNQQLRFMQKTNLSLNETIDALRKAAGRKKKHMDDYQSEFFGLLKRAIGDRNDIRIVGDRFIFQSEVLFGKGSAELGNHGKNQLDSLVGALKEIMSKIPESVNWVLRVDGHTDSSPIHTRQFPSNWELSSERAISVVKYLLSRGIPARHLVAAGFGEFQPLTDETDEVAKAHNRRIEFKLDQR